MSSGKPIIRQIAWISFIPNFILIALLYCLFCCITPPETTVYSVPLCYFLIVILLRNIPRAHRRAIKLFKAEQYAQAITEFQNSYDFFMERQWLDKYRYLLLLSSSRISYTEMALLNIAFCYTQIGEGALARVYFEKTLSQFPGSEMARSALRLIQSLTYEF